MKAAVRAEVLAARRSRSATERAEAAARVVSELAALVRRTRPLVIAGYVPIAGEPGGEHLPEALATALPPGGRLLLPVLRPDLDLDWAVYDGPDGLLPAGRGMREPSGPRLGPDAVSGVDLVLVPAVAVDRSGVRLGRGGGSYDRALARVPTPVPRIVLLFDREVRDRLPAEPHDQRVSTVITPSTGLVTLR